jgi:hypothetical protein
MKLTRINALTGKTELTGFSRECELLKNNGYAYDAASKTMIKS